MSFRCKACNTHDTGQPVRTIIKRRSMRHPPRFAQLDDGRQGRLIDRGGIGSQIEREVDLCGGCAAADCITIAGEGSFSLLGTTSIRTEAEPAPLRACIKVAVDPTVAGTLFAREVQFVGAAP